MKRQYKKWAKKEVKHEDVELISKYYQCNRIKAKEYVAILTGEQINEIRQLYEADL
jgi:hypothetical protein